MSTIFSTALAKGRSNLTVNESKEIMSQFGLPINKSALVKSVDEIPTVCEKLSFPLVMKIVSPDILHKTDVGGVLLHLLSTQEVINSFSSMVDSIKKKFPSYTIDGVLLEEEVPEGIEFIAGIVNDPTFGHCLMFGLGGIFVEVFNDISFRLVPTSKKEIEQMISEIKFSKVLSGVRGKEINKSLIIDLLYQLSTFTEQNSEHISEIDLNPIIVTADMAVIVDARIILK